MVDMPVERPGEDEVVIDTQFVQSLCKISLEDKPAGLIDYD